MENTQLKLTETVKLLLTNIIGMAGNIFNIVSLELHLAVKSIVIMTLLLIFAVFLLLCAWLAVSAATSVWLTTLGYSWPISLLFVAASNIILMAVFLLIAANYRKYLQFRSTRHQLTIYGKSDEKPFNETATE